MNKRLGDKIAIPGSYQHDAYYKGGRIQRFWHSQRLEASQHMLSVQDGDKVLDIGCGSGLLASFVAANKTVTVLGIDANASAIAFCKATYQQSNLLFEQKTTDELTLAANTFDKIALLEVIEHITMEQGIGLMADIHRLLKPGGSVVISTPNKKSMWPLIEFMMDKFRLAPRMKDDQHELLYTRKKLVTLAAAAGLKPVEQRTLFVISPWLAWVSPRLARRIHQWGNNRGTRPGALILMRFQK